MKKKFFVMVVWFPLTFVLLLLNLTLLRSLSVTPSQIQASASLYSPPRNITAAAGTAQILGASVIAGDAREILLQAFLKRHDSPMIAFADTIVKEADANNIDFRLVVAIAMCESNLGKKMPKKDEFNAWGIAVYTGQNQGKAFDSWPHAISWVSKYIRTKYYDRGLRDTKAIGAIWAPPSVENGDSWSTCVDKFQTSIH